MPAKKSTTPNRAFKVADQIQRDLTELIARELKDPRVGMVTLQAVEVTPDYAHAKVFYTSLTGAEHQDEIAAGLRRASSFLRRELGRRVRIHTLPELHFVYDPSVETGNRISALIDQALESDRHYAEEAGEGEAGKPESPPEEDSSR